MWKSQEDFNEEMEREKFVDDALWRPMSLNKILNIYNHQA
jgi:hypothetical protein